MKKGLFVKALGFNPDRDATVIIEYNDYVNGELSSIGGIEIHEDGTYSVICNNEKYKNIIFPIADYICGKEVKRIYDFAVQGWDSDKERWNRMKKYIEAQNLDVIFEEDLFNNMNLENVDKKANIERLNNYIPKDDQRRY